MRLSEKDDSKASSTGLSACTSTGRQAETPVVLIIRFDGDLYSIAIERSRCPIKPLEAHSSKPVARLKHYRLLTDLAAFGRRVRFTNYRFGLFFETLIDNLAEEVFRIIIVLAAG